MVFGNGILGLLGQPLSEEERNKQAQEWKDWWHLNYLESGAVYKGFRTYAHDAGLESDEDYSTAMFDEETRRRAAEAYNNEARSGEGWVIENHTTVEIDQQELGSSVDRYALDKLSKAGW